MKNKSILQKLESQVDKIVLAVFVLISLFLLWIYVVGNPYSGKVGSKTLGPSEIDQYIERKAQAMLDDSTRPSTSVPPPGLLAPKYSQLLRCSIPEISSSVQMPYPGAGDVVIEEKRNYTLPEVPALRNVAAGQLRGAAKVPTEEVTQERPYKTVSNEIEDVDLVTVSAQIDLSALIYNFQRSFMGPQLTTSWKDPRLATPVFARLELQRRSKQKDGQWGSWSDVPRTAIDSYQKLLSELPLSLEESRYGITNVWQQRYEEQDIQYDILQPEGYNFTVSQLEWMPPTFLDEAQKILDEEYEKEKRERQAELRRRATEPSDTRRTNTNRRRPTGRPGRRDKRETDNGARTPQRTPVRQERTIDDVQKEFENERLDEKSNIETLQDLLLVWAHDDTVEPGGAYQYRLRIGVFNPIVGKDWFANDYAEYKDQVVLWSAYSEPTAELEVPRRAYIFPMDVIENGDGSNGVEGVQVEVAKYYMGQWRDYEFEVYPGQIIGYEVTEKDDDSRSPENVYEPAMTGVGREVEPEKVDFTTDLTLVDVVVREVIWGSRLKNPRKLYTILYYDTEGLQEMSVGRKNWNSEQRRRLTEIQESIERGTQRRSPGTTPNVPDMMDPMIDPMMDPMMMGF